MMKTLLFTAMICGFALCADAQKVSRNYLDVSLSKVLEDLNQAVEDKTIFFIYNELEDFNCFSSLASRTFLLLI